MKSWWFWFRRNLKLYEKKCKRYPHFWMILDERQHSLLLWGKCDFKITKKSNQSISLTTIAAKVYYALFLKCIQPEVEKILRKTLNTPKHLTPYAKDKWSIYFKHMVSCYCYLMILYKDMKAMVHLLDNDTNFFDIFKGILQGDTSGLFLSITCFDYILWMLELMNKNGLTLGVGKARCKLYPVETMTDVHYCRWSSTSHKYTYSS